MIIIIFKKNFIKSQRNIGEYTDLYHFFTGCQTKLNEKI